MTLKELRIWHWQRMKHNKSKESKNLPQAAFHLSAVLAITEVIGGSVEGDIAAIDKTDTRAYFESRNILQSPLMGCPVCQGNNSDMPCAYPSEHIKGCLKYSGAIDPSDTPC